MKEIYLEIDGQRIKLSEEQVKILNLDKQKNKNPFEKVKKGSFYYSNSTLCEVNEWNKGNDALDRTIYLIANYYNNKDFAIKQAKEEVLNRLLKRFSYENGWNDDLWQKDEPKFYVDYDFKAKEYKVFNRHRNKPLNVVFFTTKKIAQRVINEIIIPFEQGKLEVCKIWE